MKNNQTVKKAKTRCCPMCGSTEFSAHQVIHVDVQEMEQNSRWLPGVPSKSIHVVPLEPIEVPIVVQKIADDPMLTRKVTLDTGTTGRFKLPELLPMKGEKNESKRAYRRI